MAVGLVLVCLGSGMLAVAVISQAPFSVPIRLGTTDIVFEVDGTPDCANNSLGGFCFSTGATYLAVWRYTRPTPTSLTATRLFMLRLTP